ncbi:CXXC-rich protein [Angomonas deanei]|nr:CXXC-rich protein [Angomonas deanei]|eukprot:EPY18985.1 CXXC-rich protein [Angomonas deanei]
MSYLSVFFAVLLLTISLCRGEYRCGYGCLNCTKDGDCVECAEGFYKRQNRCFQYEIDQCVVLRYGGGCAGCEEGFQLSQDGMSCDWVIPIPNCDSRRPWRRKCQKCCCGLVTSSDALSCVNRTTVEHCVRYQSNSVRCEECSDGLTISEDGLHCHNCSTVGHCKYCDASNRCTGCELYSDYDWLYGTFYKLINDTDGNQACVHKRDGCQAYAHDGTCVECDEGYMLRGGDCIYCNIPKCISCERHRRCEACEGGLEVSTYRDSCVTCDVKGCLSCSKNDTCGQYLPEDSAFFCDNNGNCFELKKPDPGFSLLAAVIVVVVVLLVLLCCVRCCVCLARRRRGDEAQALLV